MRPIHAREVLYVPHIQNLKWATSLNRLLAPLFNTPFHPPEPSFPEGRRTFHKMVPDLLPWIDEHRPRAVFYGHLTIDFLPDILMAKPGIQVWGICHSMMSKEAGVRRTKLGRWEDGVLDCADRVFTASEAFASSLPVHSEVIGLPIYGNRGKPKLSPWIHWGHRFSAKKRLKELNGLPEVIRNRLIVTFPERGIKKVPLPKVPHVLPGLSDIEHDKVVERSGYSLSTSTQDNFGYSVLESVWKGAFALAPNKPNLGFVEYLPQEMLYDHLDEIEEKVLYYDAHPDEREGSVLRGQKNLVHLTPLSWIRTLLDRLEIER